MSGLRISACRSELRSSTLDSHIASDFNSQARLERIKSKERPLESQIASDPGGCRPRLLRLATSRP
eukprot:10738286-Alexandrium_andersonii.AAC.1